MSDAVAAELVKFPGIALAVSSADLSQASLPDTHLHRAVLANFNPARSGDIYVIFEEQWFMNDFDGLIVASTHGMPWRYDTFVPIIFAGTGVPSQRVHRRVHTVDVATTLSAFVNAKPPSGAVGVPLVEALKGKGSRFKKE